MLRALDAPVPMAPVTVALTSEIGVHCRRLRRVESDAVRAIRGLDECLADLGSVTNAGDEEGREILAIDRGGLIGSALRRLIRILDLSVAFVPTQLLRGHDPSLEGQEERARQMAWRAARTEVAAALRTEG